MFPLCNGLMLRPKGDLIGIPVPNSGAVGSWANEKFIFTGDVLDPDFVPTGEEILIAGKSTATDWEGAIPKGVLDFDGVDDYVELDAMPDVTGSKVISFKMFVNSASPTSDKVAIRMTPVGGLNDSFSVWINWIDSAIVFQVNNGTPENNVSVDYATFSNKVLDIVVTKTTGLITSLVINGETQVSLYDNTKTGESNTAYIGRGAILPQYFDGLLWELDISSSYSASGYPNGNTDAAWDDTGFNATVNGSPATTGTGLAELWNAQGAGAFIDYEVITGSGFTGNAQKFTLLGSVLASAYSDNFNLEVGQAYKLSLKYTGENTVNNIAIVVRNASDDTGKETTYLPDNTGNATNYLSASFTADESLVYIDVYPSDGGSASGAYVAIDELVIIEV